MQGSAVAQRAAREELARRAREELEQRRETPEFRAFVREQIKSKLHGHQRGVLAALMSGIRFVALCCGRRAGKTHLLASLIILRLLDANFGEDVVFAAPTLDRGKELIWDELTRMIDEYCLGWKTYSNTGKIRTPWGARFRIVGLEAQKSIGKQRGGNIIAFFCDESQEFVHHLEQLLVAVGPGLTQRRGWFIASGTPGPARRGYWFRIAHDEEGFKGFRWTMRENPHLGRDADEIIAEEKARLGWADDHPTLLREYFGVWIDDAGMLVCEFLESRNALDQLPADYDRTTWKHFIGVDYGFSPDPCAWVVAAAHPHENRVLILHVEKHERFTSDQIAEKTNVIHVDFKAKRIVGDSASGGSTFIEDWNRRYGAKHKVRMRQADKADKKASIDMLNTELRTGRLQVVRSGAGELVDELLELQWKDPERTKMVGEDHAFDALRYVLRALNAFLANPKEEEPTEDELEQRRIEERMRVEAARQKAAKFRRGF